MYHPTKETREKLRKANKKYWESPEALDARKEVSRIAKECWGLPEVRERHNQSNKKRWESPEAREIIKQSLNRPETKDKLSQAAKRIWASPDFKEKMRQIHKQRLASPEAKTKASQAMLKVYESPEYRDRMNQIAKTPERRECARQRALGHIPSSETKEKTRKAMKIHCASLEYIEILRQAHRDCWRNLSPDKKDKWIRNIILSAQIKPNKPETLLMQLLETSYPNEMEICRGWRVYNWWQKS